MMRIAVAGGTGLVGQLVVDALREAEQEPVVVARSRGVDITTGEGLAEALAGVDALVDVSNITTTRRRTSLAFFSAATENGRGAGRARHRAR